MEPGIEPVGPHVHADEERRYPSTIGGALYLGVMLVALVGLVMVPLHDWRTGVRVIGGALMAAAVFRANLAPRDAGMLAVRPRVVDVLMLSLMGCCLVGLAASIPDQPI